MVLPLHKYIDGIKSITLSCLFLGLITTNTFSQANQFDSLRAKLESASDTSRFTILSQLFRATNSTDYEQALGYAEQAYRLAELLGDSVRIVEGGRMMAYSLDDLGRNDEVISILTHVVGIAVRNLTRYPELRGKMKSLYNNLAIAYMYRANYDSALSYHFKSLQMREEENDQRAIGIAKNNIGLVYFKLKNYERALEYYQQAIEIKRRLGDEADLERIFVNVGLCYIQMNNPDAALQSFQESLRICKNNCSETIIKERDFGLAMVNLKFNRIDSAYKYFSNSLELSKKQSDSRYQIENLVNLAIIGNLRKQHDYSLRLLNEAGEMAIQHHYQELLLDIYRQTYLTYSFLSDFERMAKFQSAYSALKDSIYSIELIKNLARIQTNYEEREHIRTIQEKDRNIRLQNELISRQRVQYIFMLLITILIIGLVSVLVWDNRRQQRHNLTLNEAKKIIEDQNKELTKSNEELDKRVHEKTRDLLDTNDRLIQVNEEQDNFIYKTSHDIRGPLLTLKGVCNVASLDVKDPVALDYLKRLDLTTEKLNSILTRLLVVNQINHQELEAVPVNVTEIIQELLSTERKNPIPPRMRITYRVDPQVSLVTDGYLIRIILENLIDNAIKFYNTSERIEPFVNIQISLATPSKILIQVEDNGLGITTPDKNEIFQLLAHVSERSETGGIGLYLTRLATQRLGGEIRLAETSDKGSVFHVFLPADLRPILEKRKQVDEQMKIERTKRDRELKEQREQEEFLSQFKLPKQKGATT